MKIKVSGVPYEVEMLDLHKTAEQYIRPGTVVDVDVETTAILVDLLRQALAQPKREWVGLTDTEVEAWRGNYDFFDSALVREVEAKLKEKNT